jgi:DNA sulfur modification protein DndB
LITENRLYVPNHPELPDFAQRKPNASRLKQIASYVLENYLTGTIYFPPVCINVYPHPEYSNGRITIPYSSVSMRLTDGQHRCFGIHQALQELEQSDFQEKEKLSQHQLGVFLYTALPIEEERQAFRDQNLLVQRPSISLAYLFDRRSPHVFIAKQLMQKVEQFQDNVETVENGLGTNNPKLLTLSTLVTATKFMFPYLKKIDEIDQEGEWAITFWSQVAEILEDNPWQTMPIAERCCQRKKTIVISAIFFQALGILGHDFWTENISALELANYLGQLNTLNWDKNNTFWLEKGVTQVGAKDTPIISNTRTTVNLCYQTLKEYIGLVSRIL